MNTYLNLRRAQGLICPCGLNWEDSCLTDSSYVVGTKTIKDLTLGAEGQHRISRKSGVRLFSACSSSILDAQTMVLFRYYRHWRSRGTDPSEADIVSMQNKAVKEFLKFLKKIR